MISHRFDSCKQFTNVKVIFFRGLGFVLEIEYLPKVLKSYFVTGFPTTRGPTLLATYKDNARNKV